VSFAVTYSTSDTYALVIGVSFDVSTYVPGEAVSASPSACLFFNSSLAACYTDVSGSGSELVEFRLNLETTGQDYADLFTSASPA